MASRHDVRTRFVFNAISIGSSLVVEVELCAVKRGILAHPSRCACDSMACAWFTKNDVLGRFFDDYRTFCSLGDYLSVIVIEGLLLAYM